ncbi:hypothetical protein SMALB_4995 [Streptomyces malaysiensis]|uniref:Uncharacterized protein n=1 Tax=Streptomyces malaysiensis TaxID=92644 RepID=A0A7X5X5L9_STRMQ|nr:hypothetical protein [Streptomyces malaysiensis]
MHGDDDQIVPIVAAGNKSSAIVKDVDYKVYPGAPPRPRDGRPIRGQVQRRPAGIRPSVTTRRPPHGRPAPRPTTAPPEPPRERRLLRQAGASVRYTRSCRKRPNSGQSAARWWSKERRPASCGEMQVQGLPSAQETSPLRMRGGLAEFPGPWRLGHHKAFRVLPDDLPL